MRMRQRSEGRKKSGRKEAPGVKARE